MIRLQGFGLWAATLPFFTAPIWAQQQSNQAASAQEVQELRQMVLQLQAEVAQLKSRMPAAVASTAQPVEPGAQGQPAPAAQSTVASEAREKILDFLRDTTFNVGVDTYYAYNFNAR